MFYTSDWKGDRFPDGRPKVPDDLLKRALDVSIEDVWDYLRDEGYRNQFEGGWQALILKSPSPDAPSPRNTCPSVPIWLKPSPPKAKPKVASAEQ